MEDISFIHVDMDEICLHPEGSALTTRVKARVLGVLYDERSVRVKVGDQQSNATPENLEVSPFDCGKPCRRSLLECILWR